MSEKEPSKTSGLLSAFRSVGAAFFGVQSNANREKDFAEGKFWHFALMGVVATMLLLLLIWAAVRFTLAHA